MFKKLSITVVLLAMLTVTAQAREVQSVLTSTKSASLAVSTTSTIYSLSLPVKNLGAENLGVMYKQTPATGDTAIYIEQSYARPTTEGSADDNYVLSTTVDASITDGVWHIATIDTVVMPYIRFKITGQNSNPATTVLTIKVVK